MTNSDPAMDRIAIWQRWSLIIGIAASLGAFAAFQINRAEFLRSYLFAYLFWAGMALGCLGILLLHHTVGGKWGMVIRRFCEAGARTIPIMAVLLIPVLVSLGTLYVWAGPEGARDADIQSKAAYLNVPFFIARAVFYFAIWTLYAFLLSKWSAEQDRTADAGLAGRMRALSAPGLVVFVVTTTFAFFDWIMSIEPHWFSTVYGAMFLMGLVLEAFALIIALLIILSKHAPLRDYVTPQHLHDLGNMMFAFTVLWAYLAFSQFIIIWAGNLPEEIPWYLRRLAKGWNAIAVFLIVFHFCLPFVLLLQRDMKRRAGLLLKLCAFMLVVRIVDVFWVVEPGFYQQQLQVHWTDFLLPVAIGGLWLAALFRQLRARPLVPLNDPRLRGAPRETVAF